MDSSIEAVEKILNYSFKEKSLLKEALTNFERLEFLGDSVLGLALTNHILLAHPNIKPKELRELQNVNASKENFARVAVKLGLHQFISEDSSPRIRDFVEAVSKEDDLVLCGGSAKVSKVIAVAGAVYIDVNFHIQRMWEIFRRLMEPLFTLDDLRRRCSKDGSRDVSAKQAAAKEALQKWSECMTMEKVMDDVSLHVESVESMEKMESVEAVEKMESVEAVEKMEPVEAMEKMEPVEAMEKMEPVDVVEKMEPVEAVEKILNYSFQDKSLLKEALSCYQRLEFLGDSVLGLALTNYIIQTYPDIKRKDFLSLYDLNVTNAKFARVALNHGFHQVHTSKYPLSDSQMKEIREFSEVSSKEDDPILCSRYTRVPKYLADLVEAVAGAVYIDVNFDIQRVWEIFRGLVEPIFTLDDLRKHREPAAKLKDLCRQHGKRVEYRRSKGGSKGTTAQVYIDGELITSWHANSCRYEIIEMAAAKVALQKWSECMTIEKVIDEDYVETEEAKGKTIDNSPPEKLQIQTVTSSLLTASENPLTCDTTPTEMVIDEDSPLVEPEDAKGKLFEIYSSGELQIQTRSSLLPSASQNPLTFKMAEQKVVIDEDILEVELENAKSLLRKICAKKQWPDPIFSVDQERWLKHEQSFVCSVKIEIPTIEGTFHMKGDEKSNKKLAEKSAAYHMIRALKSCLMSLVLRNLPTLKNLKEKKNLQSQEKKRRKRRKLSERMPTETVADREV